MGLGVAATDAELSAALFEQACFDLRNGERILGSDMEGAFALSLAQFQQSCEKALKAVVLAEAGRVIYGRDVKVTHSVWSVDLADSRLRGPREKVKGFLDSPQLHGVAALEQLVPRKSWESENAEYPWVDASGMLFSPAQFWTSTRVAKFGKLARAVVKAVARAYPREFGKLRSNVKERTSSAGLQ